MIQSPYISLTKHLFCPTLAVVFQVNHTVLLTTLGDSTYRFGTTYVGSKQAGPSEVLCGHVHLNISPV